ncbi:MAG: hypothetical protein LBU14_00390 [Candidatus Peribacteria bacterium]|nr:hypothetical protein [Candidatus Peribacteria bacterium]
MKKSPNQIAEELRQKIKDKRLKEIENVANE